MRRTSREQWLQLPQPFLSSEAVAAGLTYERISGAVARGDLVMVAPGLCCVSTAWAGLRGRERHLALTRAAFESLTDVVVSHLSAALVHGAPHPSGDLGRPILTPLTGSRTACRGDWRRVLPSGLSEDDIIDVDGLLATKPARTVVDCFRELEAGDALAIADDSVRRGLATIEEIRAVRAAQTRWPGIRRADRGMTLVDGRRENWFESKSAELIHRLGYPLPESQVWIHELDGSLIGRVDFLWRREGVIGEADGLGKYRGEFDPVGDTASDEAARRVLDERDRERRFEHAGFGVARWEPKALGGRGALLGRALDEARERARPHDIRCLWRTNRDEPLRPWQAYLRQAG